MRDAQNSNIIIISLALFFVLAACLLSYLTSSSKGPDKDVRADIDVRITHFSELKNWQHDQPDLALPAFLASCQKRQNQKAETPLNKNLLHPVSIALYGTWQDWKPVCDAAQAIQKPAARAFFEQYFTPVEILAEGSNKGLFTGYYEPELRASKTRSAGYATPILQRPSDLVSVDLGEFIPDLKGKKIRGRLNETRLEPYYARAEIPNQQEFILDNVLFWAADPIDTFFLHIQGSGRLRLETGEIIRIGYADQNGHPYTAIGKTLIDLGELTRESVSLQTIKSWLQENPERLDEILNSNPSFIFFQELENIGENDGPLGAQNVPLTPERSLAVDLKYHALGVPVWLETDIPTVDGNSRQSTEAFHRLMIAQDTGGAIRGPIRGDIFWGAGPKAEEIAGRMKHKGRMIVFIPNQLANNLKFKN